MPSGIYDHKNNHGSKGKHWKVKDTSNMKGGKKGTKIKDTSNMGHKAWNKGLNKENNEKMKKISENISKTRKIKCSKGEIVVWNKGLTKENNNILKKLSENYKGEGNHRFGVIVSPETKNKLSESGKISQNKPEVKLKKSISCKISKNKPEAKEKQKITSKISQNKPEVKLKQRIAKIKQIEANYGICMPGYNKTACEYFKKFDEEHNTKGRYAMYGGGEYKIEELGYFVDYINFDLKLIIEWDEPRHYVNGQLRDKDIIRQEEIQKLYPYFEFRRIK